MRLLRLSLSSSACAGLSLADLLSSYCLQRSVGVFRSWPTRNHRAAVFMVTEVNTWSYLLRKRSSEAHTCFACYDKFTLTGKYHVGCLGQVVRRTGTVGSRWGAAAFVTNKEGWKEILTVWCVIISRSCKWSVYLGSSVSAEKYCQAPTPKQCSPDRIVSITEVIVRKG